jgi:hypothetical protein
MVILLIAKAVVAAAQAHAMERLTAVRQIVPRFLVARGILLVIVTRRVEELLLDIAGTAHAVQAKLLLLVIAIAEAARRRAIIMAYVIPERARVLVQLTADRLPIAESAVIMSAMKIRLHAPAIARDIRAAEAPRVVARRQIVLISQSARHPVGIGTTADVGVRLNQARAVAAMASAIRAKHPRLVRQIAGPRQAPHAPRVTIGIPQLMLVNLQALPIVHQINIGIRRQTHAYP